MPNNLIYRICFRRPVKRILENIPYVRRLYSGWNKVHPFDVDYGTDTSGYVPVEKITADVQLRRQINPYAGSQPTSVRRALAAIPDPEDYAFVDIGCGKGRVVVIASEFPFRAVTGVELSPELVAVAQDNAALIRTKYPERTSIDVIEGNAITHPFPGGKVVVYLCHSFGRDLLAELLRSIERSLGSSSIQHLYFVYYNPVNGDLLDASPTFSRWFAEILPYDETEIGYGPDVEDTVVIWQAGQPARSTPHPGADRRIVIHKELWTAGLAR